MQSLLDHFAEVALVGYLKNRKFCVHLATENTLLVKEWTVRIMHLWRTLQLIMKCVGKHSRDWIRWVI